MTEKQFKVTGGTTAGYRMEKQEYLRELTEEEKKKWVADKVCGDDKPCPLIDACDNALTDLCTDDYDRLRITPDGKVVLVLGELK